MYVQGIVYELTLKYKNKANRILQDILFDGDTGMGKPDIKSK